MALPMMESLRRRLSRTSERDLWSTELSFEPEATELSELRVDNSVLLAATRSLPASNDVDMNDYYRGLVAAAIRSGGTYRGQRIPIPWLRLTLAGLEHKPIPLESMWEGYQEGAATDMPGYEDLFPAEKPRP